MKYTGPGVSKEETIIESAIVSQFLCDTFPSHLLPSTAEEGGPLKRAKIEFFVDTWNTKVGSCELCAQQFPFLSLPANVELDQIATIKAASAEEKEEEVNKWVAAVEKEIEPLLADASPFFGGSKDLTFAEAIVSPFLLRWYSLAADGEMIPASLIKKLDALPNFAKWSRAVRDNESVGRIYDAEGFVPLFKRKVKANMVAQGK